MLSWATAPQLSLSSNTSCLRAPPPAQEECANASASALVISSAGCPALDLDMMASSVIQAQLRVHSAVPAS